MGLASCNSMCCSEDSRLHGKDAAGVTPGQPGLLDLGFGCVELGVTTRWSAGSGQIAAMEVPRSGTVTWGVNGPAVETPAAGLAEAGLAIVYLRIILQKVPAVRVLVVCLRNY